MDFEVEIKENRYLSGRTWLLKFISPQLAKNSKGGNFLMIKTSESYDPMGRRAFAVADVRDDEVWIYYDVVGRGTKLLSQKKIGETLRVFGPLGKGLFSYEGKKHLLIGGGVGLAGLTLFGKELRDMGKEVVFVYGARSREFLSMKGWLEEEGFDFILFTDDGSEGRKGLVTEVLKDFGKEWKVSACGPKAMLRALKKETEKTGHKLYLSLEERMACGWGVCLGCVVRTPSGSYKRVCYEGPVFEANGVLL